MGRGAAVVLVQPWEIHQDLPYGTMADDEMRKLNIGCLQDDGVIFVWVTGARSLASDLQSCWALCT